MNTEHFRLDDEDHFHDTLGSTIEHILAQGERFLSGVISVYHDLDDEPVREILYMLRDDLFVLHNLADTRSNV